MGHDEKTPWAKLAQRALDQNGDGPLARRPRSPAVSVGEDGDLVWRDPPVEGEAAILADAQALVDAGVAELVEETDA